MANGVLIIKFQNGEYQLVDENNDTIAAKKLLAGSDGLESTGPVLGAAAKFTGAIEVDGTFPKWALAGITPSTWRNSGFAVADYPTGVQSTVQAPGFTAGVAGSAIPPKVVVASTVGLVAGDIIAIEDANNPDNNSLFEIDAILGGEIEIRGVGGTPTTLPFVKDDFITDTSIAGTVTKVRVTAIRASVAGGWEEAYGDNALNFVVWIPLAGGVGTAERTQSTFTAGPGGVTAGDAVYFSAPLTVSPADSTGAATARYIGVAQSTVGAGNPVVVTTAGRVALAGTVAPFIPGLPVYLSVLPGQHDPSPAVVPGTFVAEVGLAITPTSYIIHAKAPFEIR